MTDFTDNRPKAIIWDLDGTLLDTLQDLHLAVNHALCTFDMPQRTLEQTRRSVGNGVRRLVALSVPDGESNPLFEDVFAEFKEYYVHHCEDNTRPYEGICESLSALKDMGMKMAIVSNKLQSGVTALYDEWFRDLVNVAIGERDGMRRKPAPDMVELAMDQLGVSRDEAVYVGDSEVDILTARNSGLPCISVLWGFRTREELEDADCLVETPAQIVQLLG